MARSPGRFTFARALAAATVLALAGTVAAHDGGKPPDELARAWLAGLSAEARASASFAMDDPERFRFRWTPGTRKGVRLDDLDTAQRDALRGLLRAVLSDAGSRKVDAIIATEAALGVIEGAPAYRDPEKYWTAVFGEPGTGPWGLRFEGHHLSVNLTFDGGALVSATPLFLGANPERVPDGPDAGLRALGDEVDLGWALYESLEPVRRAAARDAGGGFGGFLTSAGERRARLGKPVGILATDLSPEQQERLRQLVSAYVETVAPAYAARYLERAFAAEWPHLRFHWSGAGSRGGSYYYRVAGRRLLIEHDNRSGGTHVHAIWRDAERDFGGS